MAFGFGVRLLRDLARQFRIFLVVGLAATLGHYSVLVGLVESGLATSVPATLAGYLVGGVISYIFSRNHAFSSDRPHREAVWRFALVAGVGFVMTGFLMGVLNGHWGLHYLVAQLVVTGTVMLWSFSANRLWTFKKRRRVSGVLPSDHSGL